MLSENIKIIRKNSGYSQEELAGKLHVTRQTISKWETGQSVPDANLLKQLSVIFDVSVAELIDGNAQRILENEVIVGQLSRVNEHLLIVQKRLSRIVVAVVCICIGLALVFGYTQLRAENASGKPVSGIQHIGELTYRLPYGVELYHRDEDIGVTVLKDGTQQISAKSYRSIEDMMEIGVWRYGSNIQEIIQEFQDTYSSMLCNFTGTNGTLPSETEFFTQATDGGYTENAIYAAGSFYQACIVLNGMLYKVSVKGGRDTLYYGESLVSSMRIDESLQEEFLKEKF